MNPYVVTVKGVEYDVDAPDEKTAWQWANQYHAKNPPPEKKTGLLAALGKGTENVISSGQTAFEAITGDATEAGKRGIKRGQESKYADQVGLDKVKEAYEKNGLLSAAGEVAKQIPLALTEQAPNIGAAMAAGRLGAMGGAALGSVVPGIGTGVGALIGGIGGAFAPSFVQQLGGNVERQAGENQNVNMGAAAAAAAPQAALDVVGNFVPFGKRLVGQMLGPDVVKLFEKGAKESAEKLAKETLLKTVGKGTAVSLAAEVPTEVAQQALERLQAGLPLLSQDAFKEYGETAYQAALLGPIGAASRVYDRSQAQKPLEPDVKGRAPIDVANDKAAATAAAETEAPPAAPAPPAQQPVPVKLDFNPQSDNIFPISNLPGLGVPKRAPMLTKYDKEGIDTVDLTDAGQVSTLLERINGWLEASKNSKSAKTQNARNELGILPEILAQRLATISQGPQNDTGNVPGTGGESAGIPSESSIEPPTGGATETQPNGVVSTEQNAPAIDGGEGQQQTAVEVPPINATAPTELGEASRSVGQTVTEQSEAVAPTPPVEAPVEQPAPAVTIESLKAEQEKLLTPKGRVPAPKSKNRAAYDALQQQIDDLTPTPPRSEFEPPVRAGLAPAQENKLRADYEAAKQEAAKLEKVRDEIEERLFRGQDFYNEGQKEAINAELTQANKIWNAAADKAEKTYWKLFDKEQAEQQGVTGETYVETENARRKEEQRLAKAPVEQRGSYPYNLVSLEAVHDELRDQMSHMPEYKAYIEKYFTLDRKRLKNKVSEKEAIAEGQRLIATRTLFNVKALNEAVPTDKNFVDAVAKGDVRKALQAILNHPQASTITKLVVRAILKASTLPKVSVVPNKSLGVDPTNPDRIRAGAYDTVNDSILLDEGFVTAPNLIHELMHGFLHRKIADYMDGTRKDAQIKRIDDLFQFLKANHPELAKSYGMTNLSEFTSEVMSNDSFQDKLKTIPYKKGSFFSDFAKAVLKFFGINDTTPKWNALAEALISTESVMQYGRRLQEIRTGSPGPDPVSNMSTPETEAVAATHDTIGEQNNTPQATTLRQKALSVKVSVVDNYAALEDSFSKWYNGNLRTALGRLNPMVLLSQALDSPRVSQAAHFLGTFGINVDGLYEAKELRIPEDSEQFPLLRGQNVSFLNVLKKLDDSAKQQNKTFKELETEYSKVVYGHREYQVDLDNQQLEADALAFEAAGKQKEADAKRDMKKKLYLTPAQRLQAENAFNSSTGFQEIKQMQDAIRFDMLDRMVEAGRITPEVAEKWKNTAGYTPFKRIVEFEKTYSNIPYGPNRGAARQKLMKEFEGSEEFRSTSLIENFSGLIDWMVGETMRNNAALTAMKDMVTMGAAQRVPEKAQAVNTLGGVVSIYENGELAHFHINDPLHVLAFSIADPTLSSVVKTFQKASRLLRIGVTALPPFAFKQVAEDISRAFVYARVKHPGQMTARILMNFPKEWFNEVFGKKSDSLRALERYGAVGNFGFTPKSNIEQIYEDTGIKNKSIGSRILKFMEAGAKASDLAVRTAIYEQVMKETGDSALADSQAREIINFSRRGSAKFMSQMISSVPFFNAYAQSMGKLASVAAGRAVGESANTARSMFYQRMGIMTAMGLTYALMMSGDEEYWKLGNDVRDRNWVLPYGKELGFTPVIPVAPEIGFIFKSIPERVVQYYRMYGTDEERKTLAVLGELVKRGIDVYSSPNITPQLLKPIFENMVNHSFNLGRPLESQSQMGLAPSERYGMQTSEIAKSLSKGIESLSKATDMNWFTVSPIKIENLIRGLTGSSAAVALQLGDAILNPDRSDRPLHQNLTSIMTGASAFMQDGVGTRFTDEAYALEEIVNQVHKTIQKQMEKDPELAVKTYREDRGYADAYPMVHSMMENVRSVNKLMQSTHKLNVGTPAERLAANIRYKELQQEMASQVFKIRRMIEVRNNE